MYKNPDLCRYLYLITQRTQLTFPSAVLVSTHSGNSSVLALCTAVWPDDGSTFGAGTAADDTAVLPLNAIIRGPGSIGIAEGTVCNINKHHLQFQLRLNRK